jgi:hypothetical protein
MRTSTPFSSFHRLSGLGACCLCAITSSPLLASPGSEEGWQLAQFDQIRKQAERGVRDALKSSPSQPTQQPPSAPPSQTQEPQTITTSKPKPSPDSASTSQQTSVPTIDGEYFDIYRKIIFRIEQGVATVVDRRDNAKYKPGQAYFKLDGGSGWTFKGTAEEDDKNVDVVAVLYADKSLRLTIGKLQRWATPRPTLGEPAASGIRYAFNNCGGNFHYVAGLLPSKYNVESWPRSGSYRSFEQAPAPIAEILNEAYALRKSECALKDPRGSFTILLYMGDMRLPPDGEKAAAQLLVNSTTHISLTNMAVEAKRKALEAQQMDQQRQAQQAKAQGDAQARAEVNRKWSAFREKHGVASETAYLPRAVFDNVFAYEGKSILLLIDDYTMTDRSTASVSGRSDQARGSLMLTGISPSTIPIDAAGRRYIVGTVVGAKKADAGVLPILKFRAAFICMDETCRNVIEK